MAKGTQIVRRTSTVSRRHLLSEQQNQSSLAEMAGEAAAGLASIACCAPYSVGILLVLVTCRMPAGLCRKAIRQRRRRRLIKSGLLPSRSLSADAELAEFYSKEAVEVDVITPEELQETEKAMWEHFSGAGFWRSPSRQELDLDLNSR